ncbi:non-specific lipid transfer protein GPI-anchored 12-like [Curcuma longa]|uniref:non-specific lipid transfer protein GPI-anchored 12-like n=1 Tax=Curcuma longa TaxID=136217 RepID=UPI003D9E38A0
MARSDPLVLPPMSVVALVLVGVLQLAAPPPSASAQTLGCAPALSGLSPCVSYLVGNASSVTPACCSQLAGLMQNQAQCVCLILGGGISQLGFLLNQTQAYTLPGACRISFSAARPCLGFNTPAPVGAPAGAPAEAPALPPAAPAPTTSTPAPTVDSTPSIPNAGAPSQGNGSKTTGQASAARRSFGFTPALFFSIVAAWI